MTKKATIFSERVEEIVEEILNNLQPGKGVSRAALTLGVRQALNDLSVEVPRRTKLLDRGAMREHAKKLFKAAVKLEVLLETAPGVMQAALFSDSLLSRDDLPSQQEMLDGYLKRSESFFDELYRLHIICGQAIGKKWGTHKNYDHAKALSAQSAYNLMKHYSSTKITGTEDGPFRTVTSLFYGRRHHAHRQKSLHRST